MFPPAQLPCRVRYGFGAAAFLDLLAECFQFQHRCGAILGRTQRSRAAEESQNAMYSVAFHAVAPPYGRLVYVPIDSPPAGSTIVGPPRSRTPLAA